MRPFLDLILPQFKAHFQPGCDLSIDEAMIPGFKGRIFFKQYMPAKPRKWGVKVCDAATGCCVTFDICTDRASRQNTGVSLGHEVVDKVASEYYYNQNRLLYSDRFFASVPLMQHL